MTRTKWFGGLSAAVLAIGLSACQATTAPGAASASKGSGNDDAEIRMKIDLISVDPAIPEAHGSAKFRDKDDEQELEIQVEDLPQAAAAPPPDPGPIFFLIVPAGGSGDPVDFFVDGVWVGSSGIDAFGNARLNINTDLGDTVPAVVVGSEVVATLNGTPVVAGTF